MTRDAEHVYTEAADLERIREHIEQLPNGAHVQLQLQDGSTLEGIVAARLAGPVQQPVGIEGVVDPAALVEFEAQCGTPLSQHLAVLRQLFGAGAVLAREVVVAVLAFRRHLRVQFERLEVQFDLHLVTDPGNRLLQGFQSDRAPRAGDIGDEVDSQGRGHGRFSARDDREIGAANHQDNTAFL